MINGVDISEFNDNLTPLEIKNAGRTLLFCVVPARSEVKAGQLPAVCILIHILKKHINYVKRAGFMWGLTIIRRPGPQPRAKRSGNIC